MDVVAPPLRRLHLAAGHQRRQHLVEMMRRKRRPTILEPAELLCPCCKFDAPGKLRLRTDPVQRCRQRGGEGRGIEAVALEQRHQRPQSCLQPIAEVGERFGVGQGPDAVEPERRPLAAQPQIQPVGEMAELTPLEPQRHRPVA